ncbi:MAG: hypothetical protein JWN63_3433 [Candidatus Acidoferrum typicum]|nr:hypothetical protein [Candidatus Acidoferrum typicum]
MNLHCQHKGRAVGQIFQRCLVCGSWSFTIGARWHPKEVVLPWVAA